MDRRGGCLGGALGAPVTQCCCGIAIRDIADTVMMAAWDRVEGSEAPGVTSVGSAWTPAATCLPRCHIAFLCRAPGRVVHKGGRHFPSGLTALGAQGCLGLCEVGTPPAMSLGACGDLWSAVQWMS